MGVSNILHPARLVAVAVFILFYVLGSNAVFAASAPGPDIVWQKTLAAGLMNGVNAVKPTPDDGFIILGYVNVDPPVNDPVPNYEANRDTCLIKIDAAGNVRWTKNIGLPLDDVGYAIDATDDGGYIVSGQVKNDSFVSDHHDIFLARTDGNGNVQWVKKFSAVSDMGAATDCVSTSVHQDPAGNFVVLGQASWDDNWGPYTVLHIYTVDPEGNIIRDAPFNGITGFTMAPAPDGGYVVTGIDSIIARGSGSIFLLKTDKNGSLLWNKTYGIRESETMAIGSGISRTSDGGYVLTGVRFGNNTATTLLIKLDANGGEQWETDHSYPDGDVTGNYLGSDARQTLDGGYVIPGIAYIDNMYYPDGILITKTDSHGKEQWQKFIQGVGYDTDATLGLAGNGDIVVASTKLGQNGSDTSAPALYLARLGTGQNPAPVSLDTGFILVWGGVLAISLILLLILAVLVFIALEKPRP